MAGQQKLLSVWICLLLLVALCPGAQYVYSKRSSSSKKEKGKDDGDKAPPSKNLKKGLKLAGAASAGALGGIGTGLGKVFLGKSKHGNTGNHYNHKSTSSGQDQRHDHNEGQKYYNRLPERAFVNKATSASTTNVYLTFGHVVSVLIAVWIRDVI